MLTKLFNSFVEHLFDTDVPNVDALFQIAFLLDLEIEGLADILTSLYTDKR